MWSRSRALCHSAYWKGLENSQQLGAETCWHFHSAVVIFLPLIHWLRLMLGKPVEETPKEG